MKIAWVIATLGICAAAAGSEPAAAPAPGSAPFVAKTGDTMTGPLSVLGDSWLHLVKPGVQRWNVDYVGDRKEGSTPTLQIAPDNSPLALSLPAEAGGMRMYLWPPSRPVPELPHTKVKPTLAVFGDILIGDIIAIERNPMTLFMRAETGLPATAVTALFSARAINNDVDGGAGIVMAPDQPGPVDSGYLRLIAYGQGTGPKANSIAFATRAGPDACEDRMVIQGNSGNVGIGTPAPARALHVSDVMRLEPRRTAPANPSEGDMYMDGRTHKLRVYDGTQWQSCW